MTRVFIFTFSLFLIATDTLAETGPLGWGPAELTQEMETDRPDFTEGTQTITPGHVQFELGYTYVYDDENDVKVNDHRVPELLTRIGLLDDLELRIFWAGYLSREEDVSGVGETTLDGASDLNIGIKHHMYEEDGWMPEFSFILDLGLPTGGSEVTADDVVPELKLLWAYTLEDPLSIAGNINFASPIADDDERFFEASSSLALGYSLSESVGSYLEYYGFYPNSDADDSTSTHYLSSGFTFMICENLQLDARVGFGLNDEADDFTSGLGASYRL